MSDLGVMGALRKRFERPAWALFEEVANGTGGARRRSADAVAISLWPSRGLEIHGIEKKVNRADWLRELKDPAKSDPIQKFCDRWWLAVDGPDIVQNGELPVTWGLLVLKGGKLICEKEAPVLAPEPLTRHFIAALLRRADEGIDKIRQAATCEGFERGAANGPAEHQAKVGRLENEIAVLKKCISEFESASGVKIDRWDAGDVGKAVGKVLHLTKHRSEPLAEFERVVVAMERVAKNARADLNVELQIAREVLT